VLVVAPQAIPQDFKAWVKQLRRKIAFACRFLPLFWGIGIQLVVIVPGISKRGLVPQEYVARVDNQWAIVQSIFLVDTLLPGWIEGRSPGQFVTGKFQDTIASWVARHFSPQPDK
jgi:hypothetical protein